MWFIVVFLLLLIKSILVQTSRHCMSQFLFEIELLTCRTMRFQHCVRFDQIILRFLELFWIEIHFFRSSDIELINLRCVFQRRWIQCCFSFLTNWSSWLRCRYFRFPIFYSFDFCIRMNWFHELNCSKT